MLLETNNHITVADLKNIINYPLNQSAREQKLIELKKKIEIIVNEGNSELEDILELEANNFSNSTIFDCTVYFLAA